MRRVMGKLYEFNPRVAEEDYEETLDCLGRADDLLAECMGHFNRRTIDYVALEKMRQALAAIADGVAQDAELRAHGKTPPDRTYRG